MRVIKLNQLLGTAIAPVVGVEPPVVGVEPLRTRLPWFKLP